MKDKDEILKLLGDPKNQQDLEAWKRLHEGLGMLHQPPIIYPIRSIYDIDEEYNRYLRKELKYQKIKTMILIAMLISVWVYIYWSTK